MINDTCREKQPDDNCSECGGNWRGGMVCDTCEGNKKYQSNGSDCYQGKRYTMNSVYLMSDNTAVVLDFICSDGFAVSRLDHDSAWFITKSLRVANNISIGVISDAPIELIGGCAYQFEWKGGTSVGIYNQDGNCFESISSSLIASACTDIIPLSPDV